MSTTKTLPDNYPGIHYGDQLDQQGEDTGILDQVAPDLLQATLQIIHGRSDIGTPELAYQNLLSALREGIVGNHSMSLISTREYALLGGYLNELTPQQLEQIQTAELLGQQRSLARTEQERVYDVTETDYHSIMEQWSYSRVLGILLALEGKYRNTNPGFRTSEHIRLLQAKKLQFVQAQIQFTVAQTALADNNPQDIILAQKVIKKLAWDRLDFICNLLSLTQEELIRISNREGISRSYLYLDTLLDNYSTLVETYVVAKKFSGIRRYLPTPEDVDAIKQRKRIFDLDFVYGAQHPFEMRGFFLKLFGVPQRPSRYV